MEKQMSQVDTPEGRQWLKDLLKEQEVTISFTKVSGEERVMTCTLNPSVVPPAPAPKVLAEGEVAKTKKENPDVCSVWDIKSEGWRSFRWSSVKEIQFDLGT